MCAWATWAVRAPLQTRWPGPTSMRAMAAASCSRCSVRCAGQRDGSAPRRKTRCFPSTHAEHIASAGGGRGSGIHASPHSSTASESAMAPTWQGWEAVATRSTRRSYSRRATCRRPNTYMAPTAPRSGRQTSTERTMPATADPSWTTSERRPCTRTSGGTQAHERTPSAPRAVRTTHCAPAGAWTACGAQRCFQTPQHAYPP